MNRLIVVRHGGSTGNEDGSFYNYADSAICLTTNGIRQALTTGAALGAIEPRWQKPGNFALEVFASEYTRAQQTARVALDQAGLLSQGVRVNPLLNERDYGTSYLPAMDTDPNCDLNGSESSVAARPRMRGFLDEAIEILGRADVMAFSHMGAIRALIAEILGLTDAQMMQRTVDNGAAFRFVRSLGADGRSAFTEDPLGAHVLPKSTPPITAPPAAPPQAA